jgi:hypothetical protein
MEEDQSLFSPDLRERLSMGKYTEWAVDMSPAQMVRLLANVRIFGERVHALREAADFRPREFDEEGHFFFPRVSGLRGSSVRAACGMEDMFRAFVGEERIWKVPVLGPKFEETPAFSGTFGDELSRSTETSWANSLSEERIHLLLWSAAEYVFRVLPWDGWAPSFDASREDNEALRDALREVVHVVLPQTEGLTPPAGPDCD